MKLIRNDVDYSKLPPLPSVNELKTVEDFQRLINTRGYRKPLDFMIDFGTGYKQLGLLGFRDKVVYPQNSKYQEYSNLSIEEIQNIIDNSQSKISSLYQLGCVVSKFLVTYIIDNGWESSLHFKEITNNGDYSSYVTLESFQSLIDEKKFSSPTEFKKYNNYLYNKMVKFGFAKKVYYITKYGNRGNSIEIFKYGEYFGLSLDQVQEIINKNEIFSLSQLGKYFSHRLWRYIVDSGLETSLKFKSPGQSYDYHQWKRLPEINTPEKIQKLIDDNNIPSKGYLRNKYGIIYNRAINLGCLENLKFTNEPSLASLSGFDSSWELNLFSFLTNSLKNIDGLSINHNVPIPECVDLKPLIFDIEIVSKESIIYIEVQGPSHFYDYLENADLSYTRKHDIMKNEWAINNSKEILYFCYDKTLVEKYEYPYDIITEEETLLTEILDRLDKNGNRKQI